MVVHKGSDIAVVYNQGAIFESVYSEASSAHGRACKFYVYRKVGIKKVTEYVILVITTREFQNLVFDKYFDKASLLIVFD